MKYFSVWLLCAALGSCAFGQGNPCPDSVGISTDPRPGKGYNNERPALKNTFDWFSNNHTAGTTCSKTKSPARGRATCNVL